MKLIGLLVFLLFSFWGSIFLGNERQLLPRTLILQTSLTEYFLSARDLFSFDAPKFGLFDCFRQLSRRDLK